MPEIKGLQKTSLMDYPGKVSCVVFFGSCNFRCPYCFNRDLVLSPEKVPTVPEQEFFAFLESKKKWLDGVVLGGGEPTLHKDLPDFIRKIKALGFLAALETNGTNPEMLKQLLDQKLLDYIEMDVKAPLGKYRDVTNSRVDVEKIQQSIELITSSGIDHEFRSTIMPRLHSKEDVLRMARMVQAGKVYYLQQFRPGKTLLDPAFAEERRFTGEELEALAKECSQYIKTEIRA